MPKRFYFHPAVVIPVAKVFFFPSQSYSFLKILVLEAIRQLRTVLFGLGTLIYSGLSLVLGLWEQTKSFGNASILCRSSACSQSAQETQLCLWAEDRPGETHGCLLPAFPLLGREQSHWLGCTSLNLWRDTAWAVWKTPASWEVGNWIGLFEFPFVQRNRAWTYKQRCFKGRQLHP